MAVYTLVGEDEVRALARRLGVGELRALRGIEAGIENSNYFVDTTRGGYVLTLFERLRHEQLPYYLYLMQHLARRDIPVPEPQPDADGELLFTLAGKPAALLTRLAGSHRLAPDLHHCGQLGAMLARMHLAGADHARVQPHLRGLVWWTQTVPEVLPFLDAGRAALMRDELAFQQSAAASPDARALPRGPIHADLFRDNVLFDGLPGHEKLTGLLDFFFAGTDALLFDLAVCVNDWCSDPDSGRLDEARAAALVDAYERVRALEPAELRLLPAWLRGAAFRFWLSRSWDWHLPRAAAMLQPKDPQPLERLLRERIDNPWHPPR